MLVDSNTNQFLFLRNGDNKMKVCRICGEEKLLEHFGKHTHTFDGLDSRCKDCIAKDKKIGLIYILIATQLKKQYLKCRIK